MTTGTHGLFSGRLLRTLAAALLLLLCICITGAWKALRISGIRSALGLQWSPIILPELRPSSGLKWSRTHHPQQYRADNRQRVALKGIDDAENERHMDVGGRAYSRKFISSFSYSDPNLNRPDVVLEYLAEAETFIGSLTASGLKPNFAYQMKLVGIYEDRQSFERIGYLGRWRLPGSGTNFSDSDYEAFAPKDLVESYLLFDFFLTDGQGQARKEFYADSSLHVLWNATTQGWPSATQPLPVPAVRTGTRADIYANPNPDLSTQYIHAQSESGIWYADRLPTGTAFLPSGTYRAVFVLAEESFHSYGDGGHWATVMSVPVQFEVMDRTRPPRPSWSKTEKLIHLSLSEASTENMTNITRTADRLSAIATTDDPMIIFTKPVSLPKDGRIALSFDINIDAELGTKHEHSVEILVDTGSGFYATPQRTANSAGCVTWRHFEVEITKLVAGATAQIRLDPSTSTGRIDVRNVSIRKILP